MGTLSILWIALVPRLGHAESCTTYDSDSNYTVGTVLNSTTSSPSSSIGCAPGYVQLTVYKYQTTPELTNTCVKQEGCYTICEHQDYSTSASKIIPKLYYKCVTQN